MGFIRNGLVFIISCLLFLSFFFGNIFLTLSWSLEYENVQNSLGEIANTMINDSGLKNEIEQNKNLITTHCLNEEYFLYPTNYIDIKIPCDEINQDTDYIINSTINKTIYDIYYQNYNCTFVECIKETKSMGAIVSNQSREYWSSKYNLALIVSIILFVLLFIATEKKNVALITSGSIMMISALPFAKLNWLLGFLKESIISDLLVGFFSSSYNVFLINFLVGLGILILGIALSFMKFGVKLTEFFNKTFGKKDNKNPTN